MPDGRERLVELAPAPDGDVEPLAVALERRVAELDRRARDLADERRLDDPVGDRLGERVVDDDVAEELPPFWSFGVAEKSSCETTPAPGSSGVRVRSSSWRRSIDWFHLQLLVLDVVGLVVDDHHPPAARRSVEQLLGRARRRRRGSPAGRPSPRPGCGAAFLAARVGGS